jgi:hypothetical protein
MLKKYVVLLGIILALILLAIAAACYPGGSQANINSVGYDWKNNYMSNLFSIKAVNGADNMSRPWADAGMFFFCIGLAIFFYHFSGKIPQKNASNIIKYVGIGSMVFAFLIVTPLHDIMVFYIAVFLFRSKLTLLKIIAVICLLVFYATTYMYYARSYVEFLPIMQKATFLLVIIWILCLEYFTSAADFQVTKKEQPTN